MRRAHNADQMSIVYEKLDYYGIGALLTDMSVTVEVLTADFGDGYGDGATIGDPAGLREWNLRIDVLPDLTDAEYKVNANARASVTLVSQPNNGDTMTVGGKTYTFVTGAPSGDQIQIGSDVYATAINIAAKVSADTSSTLCTGEATGAGLDLMANTAGSTGNSIALATDGTRLTRVSFANGTMTRSEYLWQLFLRSKGKSNRPFQFEDPQDITGATVLYGEFVDKTLTYPILRSQVYSAGLHIRQRRISS